jgi:lactate dehydrogenase-like 2-hydroxyacid dehydrogenase
MSEVDIVLRSPTQDVSEALSRDFRVHEAHAAGVAALAPKVRARVRIVVTAGSVGLAAAEIALLPQLGLICCTGTGYDEVAVASARARGIGITHGASTNAAAVADHAMALLLAQLRDLPRFDANARAGLWRSGLTPQPIPTGKRLGILGLGAVGERIGRRAEGFEMQVGYHTRTPKPALPWRAFPSALALAEWADHLVVAAPGGAGTHHLVDAAVLRALGPRGRLVNIGRGSVVDNAALVAALREGIIGGAGLDVYEGEPEIPGALCAMRNVILTPHIAGWAPEAREMTIAQLRENIRRFLAGEPLASPIPA